MSLNKVMIIGRLGREPELKYTQSGSPVCTFSVATDESYTDNSGQKVEKAEWHRIVVFQKAAENCSPFCVWCLFCRRLIFCLKSGLSVPRLFCYGSWRFFFLPQSRALSCSGKRCFSSVPF